MRADDAEYEAASGRGVGDRNGCEEDAEIHQEGVR